MKRTVKTTALLLLAVMMLLLAVSCGQKVNAEGLWENATYLSDTTVGEGANTVTVMIKAGEQSITLTVKTDKATLGEALYELEIINDPSFFDTCNGILASWDQDQAYWGFCQNGEMLPYGVGDEKATTAGNPTYELVYTK